MKMDEKFSSLIDVRNSDLWNDLNNNHHIVLEEADEPGYITQFLDDRIRIEVDMDALNPASLTHELLHIELKDRGVCIARDLKQAVENNAGTRELFSDSLTEHLGNCLEHYKMLPLYLSRGFKNQDFVADYHKPVMDEEGLLELRRTFKLNGAISRYAADTYIGKFFSMKTSNNKHYDYGDMYTGLQQLEPELFLILEKFWNAWQEYDPGDPATFYQHDLQEMVEGLSDWKKDKRMVS